VREVRTKDYRGAVTLLDAQVPLAEGMDHHPVATVGYGQLRLELWTHVRRGITQLDVDYAERFEALLDEYEDLLS
jgi:4a-hydroxytetrahydrobiopterin dehydratase